jgi:hypothetical protein
MLQQAEARLGVLFPALSNPGARQVLPHLKRDAVQQFQPLLLLDAGFDGGGALDAHELGIQHAQLPLSPGVENALGATGRIPLQIQHTFEVLIGPRGHFYRKIVHFPAGSYRKVSEILGETADKN